MTVAAARKILDAMWIQQGKFESLAEFTADDFARAIASAQQKTLSKVSNILSELPDDAARWSATKKVKWLLEQQKHMANILKDSGYSQAVGDYLKAIGDMSALSTQTMKAAGWDAAFFRAPPKAYLNLVRSNTLADLSYLGREATDKIQKTILDMMISGRTRTAMMSELKGVITGDYQWGAKRGLYEWHAGTYVRTESSKVIQSFMNIQAQNVSADEFLYLGPYDNKTRPFCAELVGGVYRKSEIEEMDNGQSGDVMSDCGGYNCRHHLLAVPDELGQTIRDNPDELQTKGAPK